MLILQISVNQRALYPRRILIMSRSSWARGWLVRFTPRTVPSVQREGGKLGGCLVGGAVTTPSSNLKAWHVIYAIGPRKGEWDEEEKLRNATLNSL